MKIRQCTFPAVAVALDFIVACGSAPRLRGTVFPGFASARNAVRLTTRLFRMATLMWIPMAVFEVVLALLLILKGVRPTASKLEHNQSRT